MIDEAQKEKYLKNPRTSFFIREYDRLERMEADLSLAVSEDPAFADLARDEMRQFAIEKAALEARMTSIVEADTVRDEWPTEVVMEFRAGAGGEEAALFAFALARMYGKYAEKRGWQFRPVDESPASAGGYKEASFEVVGRDAYRDLRFETGVHRVQRVPSTEKSGRIHTSTSSVAVLPLRSPESVEVNPNDLTIEFSRSGGAGGQNVNKVETAVRIIHTPSGIDVRCTSERSQQKNREKALAILAAKLTARREEEEAATHAAERREQIGTGDRSEKIRTYNFLQDRVTDHRIKESWHNIERIMEGDIDEMIASLRAAADKAETG